MDLTQNLLAPTSCRRPSILRDAQSKETHYSEMSSLDPWHGISFNKMLFLQTSTGETSMELTMLHGLLTNTFQFTADHAGLKLPLPPLLTDSTSS